MIRSGRSTAWVRAAMLACVLSASGAWAQISLLTSDMLETYTFGPSLCGGSLQVTWAVTSLVGTPCTELDLWLTTGSCGDAIDTSIGDVALDPISTTVVLATRTGTFSFDLSTLPGFNNSDGGTCGQTGVELKNHLCGSMSIQSGVSCIVTHASSLEIDYDTQPPPVPTLGTVSPKDGALSVEVNFSGTDIASVTVLAQGPNESTFGHATSLDVTTLTSPASVTVDGLVNGNTYDLVAYSVDTAGNQSANSDAVAGSPVHTVGFYENYRNAGGGAQGCSAFWGAPALLGLLMMLLKRRHR